MEAAPHHEEQPVPVSLEAWGFSKERRGLATVHVYQCLIKAVDRRDLSVLDKGK